MLLDRKVYLPILACAAIFLAGCPKDNQDFGDTKILLY